MDAPLNLAHQQGRKADMLCKAGKFDEAIACHNRAAEYILEAMQQIHKDKTQDSQKLPQSHKDWTKLLYPQQTCTDQALESLRLQHAHHIKQTDRLYDVQRRAQLLQIQQNKLHYCDVGTQTSLQGPVISTSAEHSSPLSSHHPYDIQTPCRESSPFDEDTIYHTLTENDSLIGLLLRRRQNCDNSKSFHSGIPVERVFQSKGSESPESEDKETKDLRHHNDDLRKHVSQLLKEVDELKRENKKMRVRDEARETIFGDVGHCELDLIPDLPPLEMPTFDIDFLSQDNKTDSEDATNCFGKSPI
ncbi:NRBF2-like protein [Mya arenaria]|uniref:NRBF2-like protein n=1 Tax=Mya arenaria TaxID=6604 RepID=A0ABY7FJ11_MYAAR|nr:nuclear receptor-binding factor 2-like [Mya arenaria]WAR22168.1 NRBF2-like protein [Mya arenaria]